MVLPLFDLKQKITNYNQSKKKTLNIEEDFGCPFFENTSFEVAQKMIEGINDSADLFIFTQKENEELSKRRTKLADWKKTRDLNQPVEELLKGFKQSFPVSESITEKKKLYKWQKTYYDHCQKEDSWNFSPSFKAIWKNRISYARHSHQAISTIALEWLPSLIEYHEKILKNLKWYYFAIPRLIYNEYKNYLQKFLADAKALQYQLALSILARLTVWEHTKGQHADILVYIAANLNIQHPSCKVQLTSKQFLDFHRYILQIGNQNLRECLFELSWFKLNTAFPLSWIGDEESLICVPTSLKNAVPSKIRKPNWLFKSANLRYTFCEQHALDFIQLRELPDATQLTIDISKPKLLPDLLISTTQSIAEKQKIAERLLQEIQAEPYTKLGFWQYATRQFFKNHQDILQNYYHKTIDAQLTFAESFINKLNQGNDAIRAANIGSILIYMPLEKLLDQIEHQLQTYPSARKFFQERFTHIQERGKKLVHTHYAIRNLHELETGKPIKSENFEAILKWLQSSNGEKDTLLFHFPHLTAKYQNHLFQALKYRPEALQSVEKHEAYREYILQLHTMLNILEPTCLNEKFNRLVIRYFLSYVNTIMKCGEDHKAFEHEAPLLETFEYVLTHLPITHKINIGAQTLLDHVNKLINHRKNIKNSQTDFCDLRVEALTFSKLLGEECLVYRVNKDLKTLDKQITHLLKTDPKLNCSDEEVQSAYQLRDTLAESSDLDVAKAANTLKLNTLDEVLLGLKTAPEETTPRTIIPELMKVSSQALQLQKAVQSNDLSYDLKVKHLKVFQNFSQQSFNALRENYDLPANFAKNKHHSPLFFKTYTPEPITHPAKNTSSIELNTSTQK